MINLRAIALCEFFALISTRNQFRRVVKCTNAGEVRLVVVKRQRQAGADCRLYR